MEERITLCGDNCIECPRYTSHNKCKEVCSEEYVALEKVFDKEKYFRK